MKSRQIRQVQVAHPISAGHHKRAVAQPWLRAFHTSSGVGVQPGVHRVNDPLLTLLTVSLHGTAADNNRHAGVQRIVVQELGVDDLAVVSQRNEGLFVAVVSVVLQDMP